MRLLSQKHEVFGGLFNVKKSRMPQLSPQDSVPWLPFAGTQGTGHNLAANKDQTQDNRGHLSCQGRKGRLGGSRDAIPECRAGLDLSHQIILPLNWGRDRPQLQGANLPSTFPLPGTLIAFHFSQKLLLFLIDNHGENWWDDKSSERGCHCGARLSSWPVLPRAHVWGLGYPLSASNCTSAKGQKDSQHLFKEDNYRETS